MIVIGITGGVGAGKSEILKYLQEKYNAGILLADEVANRLKEPGMSCYEPVINYLGTEIVGDDGTIDNKKMAAAIFGDSEKLRRINGIIHPAVRTYIEDAIAGEREKGEREFLFLEAALLIEEHYDEIVDEMWYIYADEKVRRSRLRESRNYSDEKITSIMSRQLGEEDFRKACVFVLDNSGTLEQTKKQIDQKMGVYLCKNQQ